MKAKRQNPLKKYFYNSFKPKLKEALDDIRHPGHHPKSTAFSMALGMFIGIFIPMGLQVWTLALLLLIIRYNIFLATLVTFISNPFTILPIYYAGILIGENISGQSFPWKYFDKFIAEPRWDYILQFGHDGIFIFLAGLFIMGIILAVITYTIAFRFAVYMRRREESVLQE